MSVERNADEAASTVEAPGFANPAALNFTVAPASALAGKDLPLHKVDPALRAAMVAFFAKWGNLSEYQDDPMAVAQ
ncbi:MAG: hypothetical protein PF961_16330 [Planctomycetota bacterium]|jgi:hypothetical protein|nr:hypothetical protein [Planctomycetota bacterium]